MNIQSPDEIITSGILPGDEIHLVFSTSNRLTLSPPRAFYRGLYAQGVVVLLHGKDYFLPWDQIVELWPIPY